MQLWEYCEVAYTPKQIVVHVYNYRPDESFEIAQKPEEWGALLAQLEADGWELVGIVQAKPANHALYYFKRPFDTPEGGAPATVRRAKTQDQTPPA
jgi:hypothetical protein